MARTYDSHGSHDSHGSLARRLSLPALNTVYQWFLSSEERPFFLEEDKFFSVFVVCKTIAGSYGDNQPVLHRRHLKRKYLTYTYRR